MTKQIFTTALTLTAAVLFAQQPTLRWTPDNPQPGTAVQVTFDPAGSKLQAPFTLCIFDFAENKPVATEIPFAEKKGKFTATYTTGKNARSVSMAVKCGEKWENNNGAGFFLKMSQANGKPVPGALAAETALYRDWGGPFELDRNVETALKQYDAAFAAEPALRTEFLESYLRVLMANVRGDEGKAAALKIVDEVAATPGLTENNLKTIIRLYDRLGNAEKAKATREKAIAQNPNGWAARDLRRKAMLEQADINAKIAALEAFHKEFPNLDEDETNEMNRIWSGTLRNLGSNNRWDDLERCAALTSPSVAASAYNSFAWNLAEKEIDIPRALQLAQKACDWTAADIKNARPASQLPSEWNTNMNYTLGSYSDTYAYALGKKGDTKAALEWQKKAVDIFKGENEEINERYTTLLETANAPGLEKELENFIVRNHATPVMKEQYQAVLLKAMDGTKVAKKMADLEATAQANKRLELVNSMLDKKAPAFTLKDLEGKEVSLESMAGKIVVVDFWATWCGPCKASFPGMQKTVDKYKSNPEIAFVFVDTWENVADKEAAVSKFITEKGYSFHVLMDNDNKVVGNFGVSGIPTKFIIGKDGKIRFKSVGFAGSDDALVEELSVMIGILQAM